MSTAINAAQHAMLLLEHLPDGLLLIDEAGTVLSANPAAASLFGIAVERIAGQSACTLLGIAPGLLTVGGAGALPQRLEATASRADGALALEAALSRLEIDGRPHLLASVRDVSSHSKALESERSGESRRRAYFRTATHELRTPMASILGFSELLLKREFDPATGRELLGIIHKQSTRLVALINQMLDLARIEAGGSDEQQRVPLHLPAAVADAIAASVPAARAGEVRLDAAPGLPAIRAHAGRLHQALSNILDNAVRFSAPGSRIEVSLKPAECDGRRGAELAIRDHGVGMTPDQRERMFDAFYRAGERPEIEGAGLGLLLVREIVAGHGGSIVVQSLPGAGTTVTLWFPAAQEAV